MALTPEQQAGADLAAAYTSRLLAGTSPEHELFDLIKRFESNGDGAAGFFAVLDSHLRQAGLALAQWKKYGDSIEPWRKSVETGLESLQKAIAAGMQQAVTQGELAAYRTLVASRPAQL